MRIKYSTPIKLDIGSGKNKKEGYTGIDILDRGQEIVWDVRYGIPVPDNSVEKIRTTHFVEHIEDKYLTKLISEIIRVCKNETEVFIACPHSDFKEAYFPCHLSLWNELKIKGICLDTFNLKTVGKNPGVLEIKEMSKNGIELNCTLIVKK